MSFDGSNNCVFHRPCLFPNGFTSAGVCGFQNTVVMDDVQMNSLTTPAINIQMPGLASHISVNDVSRISFTQLDTQIHGDVSTTGNITCSGDLLLNSKLKINSLDAVSFDGSNNCVFHRPCLFPNGFTSAGVCGFQNAVVMNDVQMNSLTTPAINIQMSGLASHLQVNDTARISFTQLDTQIHGDVSITGNLTVSGTGGGGSSLTAPVGSGLTVSGSDIKLDHDNSSIVGFDDKVASYGTWNTNGNFWDAYYSYPTGHRSFYSNESGAWIDFTVAGQTAIMSNLRWSTGAYIDVFGRESSGQYMWLNRIDTFQDGGYEYTQGTPQNPGSFQHAGCIYQILATNLQPGFDRIRLLVRKGELLINMIKWLDNRVAQPPAPYVHSDNVHGDPASLSDARLKKEVTPISGDQALSVLNQIQGCTYNREDLNNERRLGLIADEVESAIQPLKIENVLSNKFYKNEEYKTLDYSRLVSLLIPAVNALSARVSELEAKLPKSKKSTK